MYIIFWNRFLIAYMHSYGNDINSYVHLDAITYKIWFFIVGKDPFKINILLGIIKLQRYLSLWGSGSLTATKTIVDLGSFEEL